MEILIVCIGNREGGDDAVGPYIADQLKKKELSDLSILDVGVSLENFTGVIKDKKPNKLILIDAVEMHKNPGDFYIVPESSIGLMHVSTHGIPLPVFIKYLRRYINDITLIGIQPKRMDGSMSKSVQQGVDRLIELLVNKKFFKISTLEA